MPSPRIACLAASLTGLGDDIRLVSAAAGVPERGDACLADIAAHHAALVRPLDRPRALTLEWGVYGCGDFRYTVAGASAVDRTVGSRRVPRGRHLGADEDRLGLGSDATGQTRASGPRQRELRLGVEADRPASHEWTTRGRRLPLCDLPNKFGGPKNLRLGDREPGDPPELPPLKVADPVPPAWKPKIGFLVPGALKPGGESPEASDSARRGLQVAAGAAAFGGLFAAGWAISQRWGRKSAPS